MRILFFAPIFFLSGLTSCTESAHELIETRKPEAEKKFKQLYACYTIAKKTAPIQHGEIRYKTNDANTLYRESNVYQIGIESFKDLSQPLDIPFDGTRRREHADMANLFNIDLSNHLEPHHYNVTQNYDYNDLETEESRASAKEAILHFLRVKYLLINRITQITPPLYTGQDSFEPGYAKGDVLVFDVLEAKLLGGFPIEVTGQNTLKINQHANPQKVLDDNFSANIQARISEKFAQLTPSVEAPVTF